ncbi:MAG: L,D-transpeptidase family protein, partial [Bacteroidetes bacterium]|nr:L,D-transpeptidase family protein [Bacteroidota bacterium]
MLLAFLTGIYSCNEKGQQTGQKSNPEQVTEKNLPFFNNIDEVSAKMLAFYIKQTLDSSEKDLKSPHLKFNDRRIWKTAQKVYQKRNYKPIWETHKENSHLHQQFLTILDTIDYEGLAPDDYNFKQIKQYLQIEPENSLQKSIHAAVSDVALTVAFIKLTRNLRYGRLNPKELRMRWHIYQEPQTRPDSLIKTILKSKEILPAIENSRPKLNQYQKLRELIKYYTLLKENPGWKNIALGASLATGANSERVGQLRKNLMAAGFLGASPDSVPENLFDDALEAALIAYQKRFNIEPTGIAGPITLNEMNASMDEKLGRIKINLERLRWLPEDLGEKYIWVNIPDYWLKVVDNGKPVLQMKIIAGKVLRQTPVFSDQIQYLVFSPYWNVPNSMA